MQGGRRITAVSQFPGAVFPRSLYRLTEVSEVVKLALNFCDGMNHAATWGMHAAAEVGASVGSAAARGRSVRSTAAVTRQPFTAVSTSRRRPKNAVSWFESDAAHQFVNRSV